MGGRGAILQELTNRHMKPYSIYFITEDETYNTKIGFSCGIESRLATLKTGNPRDLWVSATIDGLTEQSARSLEIYLHKRLKSYHIRGEWFLKNIFYVDWFRDSFRLPRKASINLIDLPIE